MKTATAAPPLERKTFRIAEFKASSSEPGVFSAAISVFGNVDRGGDRVLKGAFNRSVEERGLPPIVWSHQWNIPPIGLTRSAVEKTLRGDKLVLACEGKLFVEDDDHAIARQVLAGLRSDPPALKEFSFGYEAIEALTADDDGFEPQGNGHLRDLLDVEWFEWGPTLVGMNPATELIDAPKSLAGVALALRGFDELELATLFADLKAGARNSTKDSERLQTIHDLSVDNGAKCREPEGEGDDGGKAKGLEPVREQKYLELATAFPSH